MQENFFKVLVIGPKGVGKSCLLHYTQNLMFDPNINTTVGADFCIKNIGEEIDGNGAKLQLWDLAGSDTFRDISKAYFPDAKACIFVIDNTNLSSFDTDGWNTFLWDWETQNLDQNIGLYIVALNKADDKEKGIIQNSELEGTALEWVLDRQIPVVKTSAKTGEGIDDLFGLLTNMLIYKEDLSIKPKDLNLENIIHIPDAWSFDKRNKLCLEEKKEELLIQPSKELKEGANVEPTQELSLNNEESYTSKFIESDESVETTSNINSNIENTQTFSKITEETISSNAIHGNVDNKNNLSEGLNELKPSLEKPKIPQDSFDETEFKDYILNEEKDYKTILNSSAKKYFKKEVIDKFCASSEIYKIKQISELTLDILLEIIRSYIDENNVLNPSKIDQYYISFKIFSHYNKYDDSVRSLNHIISLADLNENYDWISFAAIKCAGIFKNQKEYETAIDYYKKALEAERELKNLKNLAEILNEIASIYYKQEDYSNALKFFQEASETDEKMGDISGQAHKEWWIGSIFSKINQKQNALIHLKKALNLYNQVGCYEEAKEVRSFLDQMEIY